MRNFLFFLLFIPLTVKSQYGVLDTSFGNEGIVINDNNLPDDVHGKWSLAMALDINQNIYTATNYNYNWDLTGYNDNILVSKFNSNGQPDGSFAENGYKKINIEDGLIFVYDMLMSYDNYLYLVGGVFLNSNNERKMMVIKLDPDGNFVPDFGNNGMLLISFERGVSGAKIYENAQDELMIAGHYYRNDTSNPGLLVMKINTDGEPVSSFGNAGFITHSYSGFDVMRDLKLYEDGGFQVLDFSSDNMLDYNYVLIKFNSDGTLDTSFNQTGSKVIPLSNDNLYDFSSIELKSNENILYSLNGFDGSSYFMKLTEYLPNGDINTGFGNNGTTSTYLDDRLTGSYFQLQRTFVLTPDNQHIIQIGYAFQNNENLAQFALVAFDGSGHYDNQFGTNAVTLSKIHPSQHDEPTKALFMDNDRLLVLNGTHLSLACYKIYEGLSVEDISVDSKIQIAPNPTSNSFVINGLKGKNNQIQILDLSGKLIQEFKSVQDNQRIDLRAISKGTYLLRIKSNGKAESKKLIVK